jgi:hypothetical protein
MNPTHAIDQAAFNIVQSISLRPLKTSFERPIGRVEGIRMKPDFHFADWLLVAAVVRLLKLERSKHASLPYYELTI